MELSFDKNDDNEKEAWIINQLPLEQYTWGTGEIGDLDYEYYKLFSIVFRTYGYRNLEHKKSTHEDHNFNLSDTSSDQIYKGYKIEGRYPNMKRAAEETKGKIITYKGETALTPYCSWSNGTRKTYGDYPYLKKKKDKYGKHPTKKKKQLEEEGNHRQGLIANGARKMINQGKKYNEVIQYYYPGVDVDGAY
jgi:SpoIID/LytB domain protein